MTTVPLTDPTNFGNKPGDGPLRIGGQTKKLEEVSGGTRGAKDLPSQRSSAAAAQQTALRIIRDLMAGAEKVREKTTIYLPKAPAEAQANYDRRLQRSVFHNFFRRTIEGLTGLVFRKDPVLGDEVPEQIVEHWENIDNAGTHGDVFCRDLFEDALAAGHSAILIEHPKGTGKARSVAEEKRDNIRPYWVHIAKDNILSWRTIEERGHQKLAQVVLLEKQMVPDGEFGEKEEIRYRLLRRISTDKEGNPVDPYVEWYLMGVERDRSLTIHENGVYANQVDIPIVEVTTSGRYGVFASVPPLLDVAYLNIAHYQQWSDYATNIHMTCVPILFGAGVSNRDASGNEVIIGPNAAMWSKDPNAKLSYTSHSGQALAECRSSLDDLKSDMGTLGLAMLAPQKRSAETAEAKRLDKSTSDSALAVAARGLQDALELALQFHANYLRLESGGEIAVNRDFEGLLMDASVMQAYAALVQRAGFPPRLVLEMLQRGGRIADDVDLEELELQMMADTAEVEPPEVEPDGAPVMVEADNPYHVVRRGSQYCVEKADTGETVKCHPTKAAALAHFRALEANVEE